MVTTGQQFESSTGPVTTGEKYAGPITASQSFGSSTSADQSVGSIASSQPAILAGTISADSIYVTYMPPAKMTEQQNVNVDVLPVSHNDANVSTGNTIVTGTNRLPGKEGMKLSAKSQMN